MKTSTKSLQLSLSRVYISRSAALPEIARICRLRAISFSNLSALAEKSNQLLNSLDNVTVVKGLI